MNYRSIIAVLVAGSILAGCGSNISAGSISSADNVRFQGVAPASFGTILYSANMKSSTVTAYHTASGKLKEKLRNGLHSPNSVVVGDQGDVYIGNGNSDSVTIFSGKNTEPILEIHVGSPVFSLMVDHKNNVYVGSSGSVKVYPPGASNPSRTISNGVALATSVSLDKAGRLYVTNTGGRTNSVTVYKPNSVDLIRTVTQGLDTPIRLVFDSSQNFYVANSPLGTGWISVYSKNGSFVRYIENGIAGPSDILMDRSDNLYVANTGYGSVQDVAIYSQGSSNPTRTITDGVDESDALALDRVGNLYVGNLGSNTITEYAPGSSTLVETYSQGVSQPVALDTFR